MSYTLGQHFLRIRIKKKKICTAVAIDVVAFKTIFKVTI